MYIYLFVVWTCLVLLCAQSTHVFFPFLAYRSPLILSCLSFVVHLFYLSNYLFYFTSSLKFHLCHFIFRSRQQKRITNLRRINAIVSNALCLLLELIAVTLLLGNENSNLDWSTKWKPVSISWRLILLILLLLLLRRRRRRPGATITILLLLPLVLLILNLVLQLQLPRRKGKELLRLPQMPWCRLRRRFRLRLPQQQHHQQQQLRLYINQIISIINMNMTHPLKKNGGDHPNIQRWTWWCNNNNNDPHQQQQRFRL